MSLCFLDYRRLSKQTLKPNSAASYFQCFCAALSEAVKDKHLTENPAENVKAIKTTESAREYLTIEELQLLAKTECRMPDVLRRAAFFSALTGMRFSDISRLRWENVRETGGTKHFVEFKIQKTGENLTLPISAEAAEFLGKRGAPSEQIFLDLEYGAMTHALEKEKGHEWESGSNKTSYSNDSSTDALGNIYGHMSGRVKRPRGHQWTERKAAGIVLPQSRTAETLARIASEIKTTFLFKNYD